MRRPGWRCPDDERLLEAFLGELGPEEAAGVAAHVEACPLCRGKRAVLEDIAEELRGRSGDLPGRLDPNEETALRRLAGAEIRRMRRPRTLVLAGAAASALLVVAAAGVFLLTRRERPETLRGPRALVPLIEPAGTLAHPPSVFRWEAVRGAETYRLEVLDEAMEMVLSRTVRGQAATLAPSEEASFTTGKTYYWDVEAQDGKGRILASGRGSFLVVPGPAAPAPKDPPPGRP